MVASASSAQRRSDTPAVRAVTVLAPLLVLVNFTAPVSTITEIATALGADQAGQTWILGSTSLGLAALLLVAGSLADSYGRRLGFVLGAGVLALGSVVCALAATTAVFVFGRIVQGAASAALLTSSLGAITHTFPAGLARARVTDLWGAMVGGGVALGPMFSALSAKTTGWRAAYWAIAVMATVIAVVALHTVAESRSERRRRLDLPGVLTLGPGVAFLIAASTESREGWMRSWALLLLVFGAAFLCCFIIVERRGTDPMLDLRLLRLPAFVGATVGALITGAAVVGFTTYIPAQVQHVLGLGPLASSGVLGVWAGVAFVVATQASRLPLNARGQVVLGLAMCGVGDLALIGLTTDSSWTRLIPGLVILGIGSGLINATLAGLAVRTVPPDQTAMGSGANNTARYVGSALGIAVIAAILAGTPHKNPAEQFTVGMNAASIAAAVLAFAGAVVVWLCRGRRSPRPTSFDQQSGDLF